MSQILTRDSQKLSLLTLTKVHFLIFSANKPPQRASSDQLACCITQLILTKMFWNWAPLEFIFLGTKSLFHGLWSYIASYCSCWFGWKRVCSDYGNDRLQLGSWSWIFCHFSHALSHHINPCPTQDGWSYQIHQGSHSKPICNIFKSQLDNYFTYNSQSMYYLKTFQMKL